MQTVGLIAGRGMYPLEWVAGARRSGVERIVCAAFEGETDPLLAEQVDVVEWMRVGQLRRLLRFFETNGVHQVVMAGQIRPKNLYELRPDLKAMLLLARLDRRNAESLFGAIADELKLVGAELLPATRFLEDQMAGAGWSVGPRLTPQQEADVRFGYGIAKEVSRLDIGQSVVVKRGTVLAVEAFEGTNDAMRRGAALGKGEVVLVKVSKPGQDIRFDVPVIGPGTIEAAVEAGVAVIAVEAESTLVLGRAEVERLAREGRVALTTIS
jgi:hypothetical protein